MLPTSHGAVRYTGHMRLSERQQQIIRDEVVGIFGHAAVVRLFGSRVDDDARGGDIDLLVEAEAVIPESRRKSLQLVARLQQRLGDQPFDVLVVDPDTHIQAVHEQALRTGVTL